MAKQISTTVPFEAKELAEMQGLCKGLAVADVSGIAVWRRLTVLCHPNGDVRDSQRYQQASKVYQSEYAEQWAVNTVAMAQAQHTASKVKDEFVAPVISDAMRLAATDYGRKNFSRCIIKAEIDLGYRDPPAVNKGAQTGQNAATPGAGAPAGDKVADAANAAQAGVVTQHHLAEKLLVRASSIQAGMAQFQTAYGKGVPARSTATEREAFNTTILKWFGDLAESANKLHEEATAMVAATI